jgi:hypothetical protein
MPPTKESIWKKLSEHPEFLENPEEVRNVMRPYIEAMPEVMDELLDLPVNLQNLVQAKILFLRHCLDNGCIEKTMAAMPADMLAFVNAEMLEGLFTELLQSLDEVLGELVLNTPAFLERIQASEEQIILGKFGLNEEATALYKAGQLTIGKILEIDPMALVRNK